MSINRLKLSAVASFLGLLALAVSSGRLLTSAQDRKAQPQSNDDPTLCAIVPYRSWTRISHQPVILKLDEAALTG